MNNGTMLRFLRRFLGRAWNSRKFRKTGEQRVQASADGFVVVHGGEQRCCVVWSAVAEVFAYKQDRLVVDCIYLCFRLNDGGIVEISEELPGYPELVTAVDIAFPDHEPDWCFTAAFPPFATNYTTIWKRK